MTGQVDFGSHTRGMVQVALAVINEVAPGHRRGREHPAPTGEALGAALLAVFTQFDPTWSGPPTPAAADTMAAWAVRLHGAIAAVDTGDVDTACTEVNRIMRESDATPTLARHDNDPWHMHFHAVDAPWESSWAASMSTALAMVLGDAAFERLGLCNAPSCDRAYFDTSKNGTRRFCSTACQNRVKTAAFRARKSG